MTIQEFYRLRDMAQDVLRFSESYPGQADKLILAIRLATIESHHELMRRRAALYP